MQGIKEDGTRDESGVLLRFALKVRHIVVCGLSQPPGMLSEVKSLICWPQIRRNPTLIAEYSRRERGPRVIKLPPGSGRRTLELISS